MDLIHVVSCVAAVLPDHVIHVIDGAGSERAETNFWTYHWTTVEIGVHVRLAP